MSFAHLYSALRPSKTSPRNLLLKRSSASNSLIFPNFMAVDVMCYNSSNRPCLRFICKSTIPFNIFQRFFLKRWAHWYQQCILRTIHHHRHHHHHHRRRRRLYHRYLSSLLIETIFYNKKSLLFEFLSYRLYILRDFIFYFFNL